MLIFDQNTKKTVELELDFAYLKTKLGKTHIFG